MPRVTYQQTNFTAGEISPKVLGRVDVDKYANAAKNLTNCYQSLHGAAVRRPGTRYVQPCKLGGTKKARLIPCIVTRDLAFMAEFGDAYCRIFGPSGTSLGIDLASPYTEAMLPDIDYVQGADTMFLFHSQVPVQRLRRLVDGTWDLSAVPFTVLPFDEQGHYLAADLSLSSTAIGVGRTATATAIVFSPSDVGRNIISGSGVAMVTAYVDPTHLTVSITAAFAASTLYNSFWYLDLSPQGFVVPSGRDGAGSITTLAGAITRAATLTLTAKFGQITIDASAGVFVSGDAGKTLYADSGTAPSLVYVSATRMTATTANDFLNTTYAPGAWGITDSVFRNEDVGKYLRINGGLMRITAVASASAATALVLLAMTSAIASAPLAWSVETAVWNAINGYPRTGTLHEQRLWCAGSPKYPQTIWGSLTSQYLDFTKGVADNSACSFTLASNEINPISFLTASRNLIVHTYGGEFSMQGGLEKPITPTNVQVKPQTPHGSKGVRPVKVGNESIFVQRAGLKIRGMSYDAARDRYLAPDLTVLAEHITASGVVALAFQQEPVPLLWAVLNDGSVATCTLDRDQNVNGWGKHYTDGAYESVATIPVSTYEQTWFVVRRTIGGSTVRNIEYVDHTFQPMYPAAASSSSYPPIVQPATYGTTADCATVIDNANGQSVFTGLFQYEGKTVTVVADGSPMGTFLVGGGNVTLPRKSYRTLVGLPFTSTIRLLTPEVSGPMGSAQGNQMRTNEMTLRFLNTLGATVSDAEGHPQDVPFRHFGIGILDKPPVLYTGTVRVETLGWERARSELLISQAQPLPMELLGVLRKFTVND